MARGTDTDAEPVAGHGVWHFIVGEFWKVLPPTIFFAVGFNLIVLTQRILLKDYLLQFAGFMIATTTALVVGKAVLIANAIPALRRYDRKPPVVTIAFKSVFYWACVFIARLLEAYIHYMIDQGKIVGFVPYLQQTLSWRRFAFVQIWILVLFLLYTTGAEVNRLLGKGRLRRLLFTAPASSPTSIGQ
jgi:ABC-type branched-subunit amino acid transport system permease subunit